MNEFINKLENPKRIEELNPTETLKRIGILNTDIICDIGAGSGIFTIPAAKLTHNHVYGVEIKDELLNIIEGKAEEEGLKNIKLIKTDGVNLSALNDSVDIALLVTVLHEICNKTIFLESIKQILKQRARLAIIEFKKDKTLLGPPVSIRISADELNLIMQKSNFTLENTFNLGENFYCSVYMKDN